MDGARAAGVKPLVGFGHSRVRPAQAPDAVAVQVRLPPVPRALPVGDDVRHLERGQPLRRADLPPAAARRLLLPLAARECPKCTILGAELLDMPNMATGSTPTRSTWAKAVTALLGPAQLPRRQPPAHDRDADAAASTRRPDLVHRDRRHRQAHATETRSVPGVRAHAAVATRWVFDELVPLSRRITRVYLYHWNAMPGRELGLGPGRPRGQARVRRCGVVRSQLRMLEKRRQAAARAPARRHGGASVARDHRARAAVRAPARSPGGACAPAGRARRARRRRRRRAPCAGRSASRAGRTRRRRSGGCRRRTAARRRSRPCRPGSARAGTRAGRGRGRRGGGSGRSTARSACPRAARASPSVTGAVVRRTAIGSGGLSRSVSVATASRNASSSRARASASGRAWTSSVNAHASAEAVVSWPASRSVISSSRSSWSVSGAPSSSRAWSSKDKMSVRAASSGSARRSAICS